MAQNIFMDPDTNESKFDIIRDTKGNISDKDWLNRYCEDVKTKVIAILNLANSSRRLFTTAKQMKNINLLSIGATNRAQ